MNTRTHDSFIERLILDDELSRHEDQSHQDETNEVPHHTTPHHKMRERERNQWRGRVVAGYWGKQKRKRMS